MFNSFKSDKAIAQDLFRGVQSSLNKVLLTSLCSVSSEDFVSIIARSMGCEKLNEKDLWMTFASLSPSDNFRVTLQANSMQTDKEIQEAYIKGVTAACPLLPYQVENVYFSSPPPDWRKCKNGNKEYYDVVSRTSWSNPEDKLKFCYDNWLKFDEAIADIIIINQIKTSVLSHSLPHTRRASAKMCAKLSAIEFSSWLFFFVQNEKELWFPRRSGLIEAYYNDIATYERSVS